jgi:predicted amino acid racemase
VSRLASIRLSALACCGHPEVAQAFLAGGVSMLAESRLKNELRLREAGIGADIMHLIPGDPIHVLYRTEGVSDEVRAAQPIR